MTKIRVLMITFGFLLLAMPILAQSAIPVECGDIIEDEFTKDQQPRLFTLQMSAGDALQINVVPIGTTLSTTLGIYAPNNALIKAGGIDEDWWSIAPATNPEAYSDVLSANDLYTIVVYNALLDLRENLGNGYTTAHSGGVGVYTLFIGCTLRDGTVIEPGDNLIPPTPEPINGGGNNNTPPSQPSFLGFGFPGIAPVDFSDGIEIPIQAGQPQIAPVGGDLVALYTYDASANSTATLSLSRVSGDISIGVTVIKRDTNEILFIGGMPSSNNLSVDLTFPSDGTYVIGLFRMNTAEKSDTSGAVQVSIE